MSRASDRLAVVARLRELEERRALGAATRAFHALLGAEDVQHSARRAYEERPQPGDVMTPATLSSLRMQGLGALETVAEATAKVAEAAHVHTDASAAATRASVRRKSTERLRERQASERQRAAATAAQRDADEHSILTFRRKAVEGAP